MPLSHSTALVQLVPDVAVPLHRIEPLVSVAHELDWQSPSSMHVSPGLPRLHVPVLALADLTQ